MSVKSPPATIDTPKIMLYCVHSQHYCMEPAALKPTQPWYKTKGGILFLTILAILGTILLLFLAMTGYYLWVAAYGDDDQRSLLEQQFGNTFTSASGAAVLGSQSTLSVDPAPFIRSHNPTLGDATAPVTIIAFIDFECPYCQESFPIFESIRERYAPVVRIVFKHFPLASIHPHAMQAGAAAQCAHEQGMFWEYYRVLFEQQLLDEASLSTYAEQLGLNMTTFAHCRTREETTRTIQQDLEDGITLEVRGTPTYIINTTKLEGVAAERDWNEVLVEALQGHTQ